MICLEAFVERVNHPKARIKKKHAISATITRTTRLSARLNVVCPLDSRNFITHDNMWFYVTDPAYFTTQNN